VLDIVVLSARADELAAALEGCYPGDTTLRFFTDASALDAAALEAEVALGAPDVLAPALARMPRLRWVQSTWAGITPFLAVPRRDYLLTGVKGIFGASMSEYLLGWVLALERRIIDHASAASWNPRLDRGLSGLRLGIAGVGSIGAEVARRCAPFFAEVRGLNSDGRAVDGCSRCFANRDRLAFAAGLDVLALILPDTAATDGLADGKLLAQLAPGAIVINGGRANALDLPAALAALESRQLSALVLDVFAREPLADDDALWSTPGVYVTSHTAAPTGIDAIAAVFLDNLRRYRQGEELLGVIDFERGY
jgi:phosphoglycerate dehydrogenase-like enzyme